MDTQHALDLVVYLEHCGGEDRHEFWTDDHGPDINAARRFAESLRERLGAFLGAFVDVEQRVNVVRVHVTASPVAVVN